VLQLNCLCSWHRLAVAKEVAATVSKVVLSTRDLMSSRNPLVILFTLAALELLLLAPQSSIYWPTAMVQHAGTDVSMGRPHHAVCF